MPVARRLHLELHNRSERIHFENQFAVGIFRRSVVCVKRQFVRRFALVLLGCDVEFRGFGRRIHRRYIVVCRNLLRRVDSRDCILGVFRRESRSPARVLCDVDVGLAVVGDGDFVAGFPSHAGRFACRGFDRDSSVIVDVGAAVVDCGIRRNVFRAAYQHGGCRCCK